MEPRFVKFIFYSLLLFIGLTSLIFQFFNRSDTSNNGGPQHNNFGMINNLSRANNSYIIDIDNNNNINLSNLYNNSNITIIIYNYN
jgi:hypothetical protein